ncbi:MAG: hypothetical protein P4M14_03630 [Gammaproteobacteria bacterium]|nr:hypothetical protein [Gammaproteobacteria bacterium]
MRKLAILVLGTLLMISNSFAGSTGLDAQSLSKSLNAHKVTGSEKGSFEIVYGGQDISRGSIGATLPSIDSPILVG